MPSTPVEFSRRSISPYKSLFSYSYDGDKSRSLSPVGIPLIKPRGREKQKTQQRRRIVLDNHKSLELDGSIEEGISLELNDIQMNQDKISKRTFSSSSSLLGKLEQSFDYIQAKGRVEVKEILNSTNNKTLGTDSLDSSMYFSTFSSINQFQATNQANLSQKKDQVYTAKISLSKDTHQPKYTHETNLESKKKTSKVPIHDNKKKKNPPPIHKKNDPHHYINSNNIPQLNLNNKDRYLEATSPKSYGMEQAKRAILEAQTTPPLATFNGELQNFIEFPRDKDDFSSFTIDGDIHRGYGFIYFTDLSNNCIKEFEISTKQIRTICESFKGWSKPCGIFNLTCTNRMTMNNQTTSSNNNTWVTPSSSSSSHQTVLLVCDCGNNKIRKLTKLSATSWKRETFAGLGTPNLVDGSPSTACFKKPSCISRLSNGNLVVSDSGNHAIRLIHLTHDGLTALSVKTIAGGKSSGYWNGIGESIKFRSPQGICVDKMDRVIVCDSGNNCVRALVPFRDAYNLFDQSIFWKSVTIAGSAFDGGLPLNLNGLPILREPTSIVLFEHDNSLLINDQGKKRILVLGSSNLTYNSNNSYKSNNTLSSSTSNSKKRKSYENYWIDLNTESYNNCIRYDKQLSPDDMVLDLKHDYAFITSFINDVNNIRGLDVSSFDGSIILCQKNAILFAPLEHPALNSIVRDELNMIASPLSSPRNISRKNSLTSNRRPSSVTSTGHPISSNNNQETKRRSSTTLSHDTTVNIFHPAFLQKGNESTPLMNGNNIRNKRLIKSTNESNGKNLSSNGKSSNNSLALRRAIELSTNSRKLSYSSTNNSSSQLLYLETSNRRDVRMDQISKNNLSVEEGVSKKDNEVRELKMVVQKQNDLLREANSKIELLFNAIQSLGIKV